jgi:exonuclease III
MNNNKILKINTFNCRGLRNNSKRTKIFEWLKSNNQGVVFLQETHSIRNDEKIWEREWEDIFFTRGIQF